MVPGMFFKGKNITEAEVRKALAQVQHPNSGKSIAALGLVSGVVIREGQQGASVTFVLTMKEGDEAVMERLRATGETAVRSLKGVAEARALFTAAGHPQERKSAESPPRGRVPIDVKHLGKIISVVSGKGGVGKSTVAANLAVALAQKNLRIGLLDADVYGPSVPRLFALSEKPETKDHKLQPLEKYGLKIMSIGFMVGEETPVIWRGAMVQTALKQMLQDVAWGELDALIIDMPPGTGDAQLTFAQSVPMAGAVIVSTPQDLALIDARKAIAMFKRVNVPILGLIENMSSFVCPNCGKESDIFGKGGARAEAERVGANFLCEIPLTLRLRETSDAGTPLTAIDPDDDISRLYQHSANIIWEKLRHPGLMERSPPKIVIED